MSDFRTIRRVAVMCGALAVPALAGAQTAEQRAREEAVRVRVKVEEADGQLRERIEEAALLAADVRLKVLEARSRAEEEAARLAIDKYALADELYARDETALARAEAQAQRVDEAKQRTEELKQREAEQKQREEQRAREQRQRAEEQYSRGQEELEDAHWAQAVDRFQRVIDARLVRVDAALYWKAYALSRLGQQSDALVVISELSKGHPQSRWLGDAKALEIQVRQNVGQAVRPEAESDEELKLLAIQGLQHSDPEQAVPMLEKLLQGNASPRLKARALFVLAQSNSERARQVMNGIARGNSNPDLQRRAIQYLGQHGRPENRQLLADVYAASSDVDVKRQILRAFMTSGDRTRVLAAATTEKDAELRAEAVRQLGNMGARDELWQLYQKESSVEIKRSILQSLFNAGETVRISEIAASEPNTELRRSAVRHLGNMGARRGGDTLSKLYATEKEVEIKRLIIQSLFNQNNAEALVAIARKETDPVLKKDVVSKLSNMSRNKVAMDYLVELLGK